MSFKDYIPEEIMNLYEIHDYKHAAAILSNEFPSEFSDICTALRQFRINPKDITNRGGNESNIPKSFSAILRPLGWKEVKLEAKIVINEGYERTLGTHKIDYVKGRVALDLEWNSKDQTFDRDLFAFSSFFDYDKISIGILITRSLELNKYFFSLGKSIVQKYGASTTHMMKLLPRLDANRNGGCPVLVFGITSNLIKEEINE